VRAPAEPLSRTRSYAAAVVGGDGILASNDMELNIALGL
jgi:hypothetical protein